VNIKDHIEAASRVIDGLNLNPTKYIETKLDNGNSIFSIDSDIGNTAKIKFNKDVTGSRIYIGKGLHKSGARLNISGSGNIIYIGDNCYLGTSWIETKETNSCLFIGSNVSITNASLFTTGQSAGGESSAIIIGDDCLFASGVTVRGTDSHPMLSIKDFSQLNKPKKHILIEPHVWVCQNASILKDITIGACSIIGLGAIVTKDIPRFHSAVGSPAKFRKIDAIWTRNNSKKELEKAKKFVSKYHV
jgi:acetyltransferase-like isoleucine patch superfamily enzyme